jgi:hypothetical protein
MNRPEFPSKGGLCLRDGGCPYCVAGLPGPSLTSAGARLASSGPTGLRRRLCRPGESSRARAVQPDHAHLEATFQVTATPMLGDERDEGGEDVRHSGQIVAALGGREQCAPLDTIVSGRAQEPPTGGLNSSPSPTRRWPAAASPLRRSAPVARTGPAAGRAEDR